MIKHGSKMIQAVANAGVPQFTVDVGSSFGAGNYGMCGRGFGPDFGFTWPNASTTVMGAEQAAITMAFVVRPLRQRKARRRTRPPMPGQEKSIVDTFESQSRDRHLQPAARRRCHRSARHARCARLDALDLRERRELAPMQFGVARP